MARGRWIRFVLLGGLLAALLAVSAPWLAATWWGIRSSNPVRRGLAHARELGCFSCHGPGGTEGIPVSGADQGVPGWTGGVWMMYVEGPDDVRRVIAEGSTPDGDPEVVMPAYGAVVDDDELDDLVAAFTAVSGMVRPARGTPARRGLDLAREWRCFACHGPAGSGGLPNPGSFTGFVPGWYGPDFEDLVRDRDEFDTWIREGTLPRLADHPIASRFLDRQRIAMPAYPELTSEDRDALWAYARWLAETDGGHDGEIARW